MLKKILFILSYFVFFCSLPSFSQEYRPEREYEKYSAESEQSLINRYVDSLKTYRQQLDSLQEVIASNKKKTFKPDFRYCRLFMPTTYSSDIVNRRFSMDSDLWSLSDDERSIDNSMLDIYIHHPELVSYDSSSRKTDKIVIPENEKVVVSTADEVSTYVPKADEMKVEKIDLVVTRPNFWTLSGDFNMQIMQNSYSKNWYQGGENNYSALGKLTLKANYNNKQKVKFENTLEMQLGFRTNSSDTVHSVKTSTDLLRYTGKFGLQATKKWYYTLQAVATSQFCKSFANNSNTFTSAFLSPANVNISLGMDYTISWFKNKMTGSVHLAPLALNYKYVGRDELVARNGIEEGKHHITDYGSTFQLNWKWKFSDSFSWTTRLYGYTTYKRTDLQWENTFDLRFSKYITAQIYIYPRFDDQSPSRKDEKLGYFQVKEYTSLGFSYSF